MTAKTTDFPSKTALVDLVEQIKTDLSFDESIAARIKARLQMAPDAANEEDLLHQVKGTIDPALSNLLADFAIERGKPGKRRT